VEGIPAPDWEWQDAYVLGVSEPLETFTGIVAAVIHRLDDVEDKWVVLPEGMRVTEAQIRETTFFQERFFRTEVEIADLFCYENHLSANAKR
jgi:inorganic pyrophosphatase